MSRQGRTAACPRSRGARRERGAVAVEFALVLPILVILLLGIVTGGIAYSHGVGLANAVREGARFAAIAPDDGSWKTDVVARTRATQFDDPAQETKICVALLKNPGAATAVPTTALQPAECFGPTAVAAGAQPAAPPVPGGGCVALVWATRPYKIDIGFKSWTSTMQRQSVARYERTC